MTKLLKNSESNNLVKPLLAEVISREQYLNALELIDKYNRQNSNVVSKGISNNSIKNAEIGNFVFCKYVGKANTKCLTKGKTYEIIDFVFHWKIKDFKTDFFIIDDNGKRKRYDVFNVQFSLV
jgi:hypothetical protein